MERSQNGSRLKIEPEDKVWEAPGGPKEPVGAVGRQSAPGPFVTRRKPHRGELLQAGALLGVDDLIFFRCTMKTGNFTPEIG